MKKVFLSMLIVGFGTLASAQIMSSNHDHGTKQDWDSREVEHLEHMKTDLNLTDAQVAQIKGLHEKNRNEKQAQKHEVQKARLQKQQYMDDEMRRILTPAQYVKWQTKKAEKMKKRKEFKKDKANKYQEK